MRFLPGHRKANLHLANELYSTPVKVEFVKVEEDNIGKLMNALKMLRDHVYTYYDSDQVLLEKTEIFIRTCRGVATTILTYNNFFIENNNLIVDYFTFTKKRIYTELFRQSVSPIVDVIKVLRKEHNNAYMETLIKIINEKNLPSNDTYIITKNKFLDKNIEVNGLKYHLMSDKEFVDSGIFTHGVLFLGTPSYFDHKFTTIFYARETIFLGYSCFDNKLVMRKSFKDLISPSHSINTIYKNVSIGNGFSGLKFTESFLTEVTKNSEENFINRYTRFTNIPLEENVEVKLAKISNNGYIFLPIRQKVNIIDKDSLKISQEKVKELSSGDLLVFREQNAVSLIREEADKIIGEQASRYRESLEVWKKKLRFNIEKKGIEKVSKILIERYGILVAKENNIKNWISSHSIKPTCLDKLLKALKFELQERTEILNAANKILSAHISAGHYISHTLMNEINNNLESIIDENGYYSFKSIEFKGASFNIVEVKNISIETYFVPENDALKIIKAEV